MTAIRTVNLPRYPVGEVINLLTYLFANLTIMSSFKTVRIDMVSFPTKLIGLTRKRLFFLLSVAIFRRPLCKKKNPDHRPGSSPHLL